MVQATPWARAAQPTLWPWLPRVALMTSRGSAPRLCELLEIGQAAADLEGAHRRVVLVLDPAVGAQALAQQRPAVLRRGLEMAVDHLGGSLDFGKVGQVHHESGFPE
jgi:hypothetical protein